MFGSKEPVSAQGREEVELAFWLERAEPAEPGLAEALVERYAGEVLRLAAALLGGGSAPYAAQAAWQAVGKGVFIAASANPAGFQGRESVRLWLLELTLKTAHSRRRRLLQWGLRLLERWSGLASRRNAVGTVTENQAGIEQEPWASLVQLPPESRLPLLLRYLYQLPLVDIVSLTNKNEAELHAALSAHRQSVLAAEEAVPPSPHLEFIADYQKQLDGLLIAPDRALELDAHLGNCQACREQAAHLKRAEGLVARALQKRWPEPPMTPEKTRRWLASVELALGRRQRWTAKVGKHLEALWVAVLVLLALTAGRYLLDLDAGEGSPQTRVSYSNVPTPLPSGVTTAIPAPPSSAAQGGQSRPASFFDDPVLSADGAMLAYTYASGNFSEWQMGYTSEIFFFNRHTGLLERGSATQAGEPADSDSFQPDLSDDGRWLVFASQAGNLAAARDRHCPWPEPPGNCADIFSRDLTNGTLLHISRGVDGGEADGQCFFPAISGDGLWIAYWSAANNLVEEAAPSCQAGERGEECWHLYPYDVARARTQRIPIGRSAMMTALPELSPIKLSYDGRWLALVLSSQDAIAPEFGISLASEAVLFNRTTGLFERLNVSSQEVPGDRESMAPTITPDGRYVAFVSLADNLVPEDNNGKADVFVRDRLSGKTERVSLTSEGVEGEQHSGGFFEAVQNYGIRLGLSADGRYVVFLTQAVSLAGAQGSACPVARWQECLNVLVHDRNTGLTTLAIPPQPNVYYLQPDVSLDGRWLALIRHDLNCINYMSCIQLALVDRDSGELSLPAVTTVGAHQKAIHITPPDGTWARASRVAFSHAGKYLAVGSSDGKVQMWQIDGEAVTMTREITAHTMMVADLEFSPDGRYLATAGRDGKLKIYLVADGAPVASVQGFSGAALSLDFSPGGAFLAAGGSGGSGLWKFEQGSLEMVDYRQTPGSQVNRVAYAPDGALLALAMNDGTIWLRRLSDGQVIARLGGHRDAVLALAFSPDGRYLASGDAQGDVNIWERQPFSGDKPPFVRRLTLQHGAWINDLVYSHDSSLLAVASLGSGLRLWRLPGGELLNPDDVTDWDQPLSLDFCPSGDFLAVGSLMGGVQLWRYPGH